MPQFPCEPLHRLQREVPLPSLDAPHVGPMDIYVSGQGLLTHFPPYPISAQIESDSSL